MQSKISEYQVSNVIDEFELQALSVSSSLLEDAVRIVLVVCLASLAGISAFAPDAAHRTEDDKQTE